jgi:acylphosphatase
MDKEIILKISGKVQGVLFRANAKKEADQLGICGFAQNENDNSVTIVAQGTDSALSEFEDWCRIGPKSARIKTFKKKVGSIQKPYKDFSIKY